MTEHLSKQYDSELDAIRAHVTRMGGMVEEQVQNALKAFATSDRNLMELVISRDKGVDEMEMAIDESCSRIVARRQPAAFDLRLVMAVGKIVTDLERIGDEAKKIARTTFKIMERGDAGNFSELLDVKHMGERAANMFNSVLDAFVRLDATVASQIMYQDQEVDRHFSAIVRQLITYMMEDPRTITTALDTVFIAKSIERIGDHTKNIAEDVIYIAKGRDVRHTSIEDVRREVNA